MRPTIIMLPATPPGDSKYGLTPHQYPELGDRALRVLPLNRQVWYNDAICAQAAAWILEQNAPSVILIGFSKSALGAWKLTQILGERVHATVMFDAPVARLKLPPWDTATFYRDDADWQQDLPINTLHSFAASRTSEHKLILISGAFFHDEMSQLHCALTENNLAHVWIPNPDLQHHWQSGWLATAAMHLP